MIRENPISTMSPFRRNNFELLKCKTHFEKTRLKLNRIYYSSFYSCKFTKNNSEPDKVITEEDQCSRLTTSLYIMYIQIAAQNLRVPGKSSTK